MNANEYQVDGTHYRQEGTIQHWDYAASHNFDYFQGQITKYITRWKKKNGLADLEKARHFIEKYIEIEKKKIANGQPFVGMGSSLGQFKNNTTKSFYEHEQKTPFGYVASDEN